MDNRHLSFQQSGGKKQRARIVVESRAEGSFFASLFAYEVANPFAQPGPYNLPASPYVSSA